MARKPRRASGSELTADAGCAPPAVDRADLRRGRTRVGPRLAWALAWLVVLSFVSTTRAEQPPGHGFAVAPYLLDVTRDSATVAFHLREPLAAEVIVDDDTGTIRATSPTPRRAHFVRVRGLAPGRAYRYRVRAGDGAVETPTEDPSYEIRTAGLAGETFTFVVYGDPRPGDNRTHRHHQLVLGQIAQVEPAFSLVLGDMVDDGAVPAEWEAFLAIEAELRRRSAIFPVLGDNDVAEGRGRAADYFPRAADGPYHFEWAGTHFFGMNAWGTLGAQPESELGESAEQVRWLREELSRDEVRGAPFRIVFLHDPVYISRGRSSELLRRVWAPLFTEGGVDLVFASWHLYERSRHDGVSYVISGGAGAELVWLPPNGAFPSQVESQRHHFCRVDVDAGALQLRAIAEDGTVLDSLTLVPRRAGRAGSAAELQRLAERAARIIELGADLTAPALDAQLFSTDCSDCRRLLEQELPPLVTAARVRLRVRYYDLSLPGTYDLLVAAGADFGRQDAELPALFVGRRVLGGAAEIRAGLADELRRFADDPDGYRERAIRPFAEPRDTHGLRAQRFEALSLPVVLAAGLLDGVNPCAFTTVIFLLSYLSVTGGSRRRLLVTGALFTLAVFLTYLAIGVLFYQIARVVLGHGTVATVVNAALLVALLVLAVASGIDAVRSLRGRSRELALSLPSWLSERIRGRIRSFARNPLATGAAAFSLGVVVALLELACTGQVYVPIVAMIADPRHRAAATIHLVVYNVAFIVPLVMVFVVSAMGLGSQRLVRLARRHVATAKLALAVLFVGLAYIVASGSGWAP